jgi:Arc/MetJ-type ribon-helix-helix transcriptional regulator
MSKGTKPYTFRLPEDLVAEMEEAIKRRNARSAETPWTWSDFVRTAIAHKLAPLKRARARATARQLEAWDSPESDQQVSTTGGDA